MTDRPGSIVIESVSPQVDGGRYPVKRIVGERLRVEADIFKEGHDALVSVVRWKQLTPAAKATDWQEAPMRALGNDRWAGDVPLPVNGRLTYMVEAWTDPYQTWVSEVQRKVAAGRDIPSELLEGAALLESLACRARAANALDDEGALRSALRAWAAGPKEAFAAGTKPEVVQAATRHADRSASTRVERPLEVFVDRERAQTGAWYEFFPRSAAAPRHGTFQDAEALLPYVESLGFDVIYFPPIHPIGRTSRKGRNNALSASTDDVGSPWAIGSEEGGHKSILPALGNLEDFRRFVGRAAEYGIEVALDLAFQCAPDHPYVKEHPEWFHRRQDGSIKTAENPPKRYEDIVNFDWMGAARDSLWAELQSVVLYWIEQGVKLFRVDNPHTKPLAFWEWLIRGVQDAHPEVVFLAEAFTRPKMMRALAKAGFSQSYTYFTWRNFKEELVDYLEELTQSASAEYMRGNLWPNTPDILPEFLQTGGPPAFKLRLALAATLSSSYGIYQGYELCEARALPKSEEYLDSEKYQLTRWDFERPGNIRSFVTAINRVRKEQAALREYRNLRFYPSSNELVIFYGKTSSDGSSQVLVAVSLDPFHAQVATLDVPLGELGPAAAEAFEVEELLSRQRTLWKAGSVEVQLTPEAPAAIWSFRRSLRNEQSFDYYG